LEVTSDFSLGIGKISYISFFIIDYYSSIIASFQTTRLVASSLLEGSKSMRLVINVAYPEFLFCLLLFLKVPCGVACPSASYKVNQNQASFFLISRTTTRFVGSL